MPLVEIAVLTLEKCCRAHPGTARFEGTGGDISPTDGWSGAYNYDSDRVAAEHRPETAKVNEFAAENREKP